MDGDEEMRVQDQGGASGKRVLMVATVPSMIGQFNMANIKMLLEMGCKVDVAADFSDTSVWPQKRIEEFKRQLRDMDIECVQLNFSRSPLRLGRHMRSYKEVRELLRYRRYSLVHTHTPIASAIVRLAARKAATPVIYTAHGFHFYDRAPLRNWLLYYPIEKWLSRYTDVLITINKEDYARASKKFRAKKVEYVPGVGVDIERFRPDSNGRKRIRQELGVSEEQTLLLSVGELNENKNHGRVIEAIAGMGMVYVIVGNGPLREVLEKKARQHSVDLRLTGYRSDVEDFYNAADIFVLPSIREGLNVSLMEAMASGLPCAASRIRGNVDLMDRPLFDSLDTGEISRAIDEAMRDRAELGRRNLERVKELGNTKVAQRMSTIYGEAMDVTRRHCTRSTASGLSSQPTGIRRSRDKNAV